MHPMTWRRRRPLIIAGSVTAVLLIPTAVFAAGRFTDDDDSIFEDNIEWLASAGVTVGCNPPDNTNFCPDDNVTRGQMAAFMQRFAQYLGAEDGTPAEADNADTLDGFDSADFASAGIVVRYGEATVADATSGSALATCLEGEVLVGGGAALSAFVADVALLSSRPADSANPGPVPVDGAVVDAWRASATNPAGGTGSIDVRAFALCSSSGNLAGASVAEGADGP
jgi:hypothetical protein